MKKIFNGFSIIELITAVAIVAILSAIAVPLYRSYNLHAKLSNAIPLINAVSEQLIHAYQTNNSAPTINIGTSGIRISAGSGTLVGTGGSIFPLVQPFPVETLNATLFNRGWVVIQGASPLKGFAISSTRKSFDGNNSVLIVHDYQLGGLNGMTGYIAPGATSPYVSNGHGIIRNLIVIDEDTGLISKYCGNASSGTGQYDIQQVYLDGIGCTCRTVSSTATSVSSLNCQ